jgi:hypothetical protein
VFTLLVTQPPVDSPEVRFFARNEILRVAFRQDFVDGYPRFHLLKAVL